MLDDSSLWTPEEFGFTPHKINERMTREDIFYRDGGFQLRRLANDRWLCRRKMKNERGNDELLIRFFVKILPDDRAFAEALLTKGLD